MKRAIFFVPSLLLATLCLHQSAVAQEFSFRRAVELALQHSGTITLASAEEERARQSLKEGRNLFLPQLTVGSGLAATYGFPLSLEGSSPSIINVNEQNFLINPAQREFNRAARSEWTATGFSTADRKNQVILETALDYAQLDAVTSMLRVLEQQQAAAGKAEQITSQRVQAGVDNEVELTRSRLASAKARMRIAEAQGSADLLRERLSQLTGVPAGQIQTSGESIPRLPEISQETDLAQQAVSSSPQIKQANESAFAKHLRALGEHRMSYPAMDFVAQYGLFSKANNYQKFFARFQRNNATVGVAIRFPFLNFAQRAHAAAADAEAVAAKKQADSVKEQVSNETLKLQRSVRQLAAAKEVSQLEYQLAHSDAEAAAARVQAGQASLKDQERAYAAEQESYFAYLQSSFQLVKAEVELLRQTNELRQWALGGEK